MIALLLIIAAMIASLALGIYTSGYLTPSLPPELAYSEPYCLTEEALDSLLDGPVVFTCGYLDDPSNEHEWVLAAEDAQIDRVFIHDEKQLMKRAECDGVTYYSWLCHPPDYGSLWKNTLWKLNDADPTVKSRTVIGLVSISAKTLIMKATGSVKTKPDNLLDQHLLPRM